MKVALLIASLSLLASADALTTKHVGGLTLQVPGVWKHTVESGTEKWVAPSQDAAFELDVFKLDNPLEPKECRDKLVSAMGEKGWEKLSVGNNPAARKVSTDKSEEKKVVVEVETWSYVGCDGHTKWALTFTMAPKQKDRFAKLAKQIVESIQYKAEEK